MCPLCVYNFFVIIIISIFFQCYVALMFRISLWNI